jgi:hypothetical protein
MYLAVPRQRRFGPALSHEKGRQLGSAAGDKDGYSANPQACLILPNALAALAAVKADCLAGSRV